MKNIKGILIIWIILSNSVCMLGQEFKSGIFFEDSNGDRDTVYIGYDPSSTIQVDTQFDELDISDYPISQGLDIRLSQTDVRAFDYSYNIWDSSMISEMITYESKVDILPRQCQEYDEGETIEGWPPYSTLLIPIKNLPLTITWDSTMFDNNCLNSSILTLWTVNTWWDTQSFQEVDPSSPLYHNRFIKLSENDELIIEKPMGHRYINEQNDTMMMVFIVLNDNAAILSKVEDLLMEKRDYIIYPNPCKESVNIVSSANGDQKYKMFSLSGVIEKEGITSDGKIDVSNIKIGIYFIQVKDKKGNIFSYKMTKI